MKYSDLAKLGKALRGELEESSAVQIVSTGSGDRTEYAGFYACLSKPIIDETDRVLAERHGLTDEELGCIMGHDIRYQLGVDGADGE